MDIIISIRRGEGNTSPTVRVLYSLSRFDETPDKLVIDLRHGEYVPVGTAQLVALRQAEEAILKAAPDSEEEAKTSTVLIDGADGVKPTIGKEAIASLFQDEKLQRIGAGVKGNPYRPPENPVLPMFDFKELTAPSRASTREPKPPK